MENQTTIYKIFPLSFLGSIYSVSLFSLPFYGNEYYFFINTPQVISLLASKVVSFRVDTLIRVGFQLISFYLNVF